MTLTSMMKKVSKLQDDFWITDFKVETDGEDEQEIELNENNEVQENPPNPAAANQIAVAQDWNPVIEWDRGAEDITWERVCLMKFIYEYLI